MKSNKCISIILGVLLLFSIISCENWLSKDLDQVSVETSNSDSLSGGTVTLKIPRYIPSFTEVLRADSTIDPGRAMIFADSVYYALYNREGYLVFSSTGYPDAVGDLEISLSNIPWGSGYYMYIEIYNLDVSATDPVVSGTTDPFDVDMDDDDVEISAVMTPESPTVLNSSQTEFSGEMIGTIISLESDPDTGQIVVIPQDLGGERWFSYTAEADGTVSFLLIPGEDSFASLLVFNEDSSSFEQYMSTGYPFSTGTPAEAYLDVLEGETYYLGAAIASDTHSNQEYTLIMDENVILLPDSLEYNESPMSASELTVDGGIENLNIHNDYDTDCFVLDLVEGEDYILDIGDTIDPYFALFDSEFNYVTGLFNDIENMTDFSDENYEYQEYCDTSETDGLIIHCDSTETYYLMIVSMGSPSEYTLEARTPETGTFSLALENSSTFNGSMAYAALWDIDADMESDSPLAYVAGGPVSDGVLSQYSFLNYSDDQLWSGSGYYIVTAFIDINGSVTDLETAAPDTGDFVLTMPAFIDGNFDALGNETYFSIQE